MAVEEPQPPSSTTESVTNTFQNENVIVVQDDAAMEEEEDEEAFYERIEAPKFVDFTAPHHYNPDDRYWFCRRVGCDQKHEEEMDSEAIYKNFVLRVMAARSPNIKLRRALNRNAASKCPLSAPPKPSKPRLSRLAMISSISQKINGEKGKVRPVPKLCTTTSTPKAKAKQVAAKYLTTPRNKNVAPNPNSFRSVQNPKPTTVVLPKSRTVAKALVFHSPKKPIRLKSSVELRTPLTKLCEGMKKLEITSDRKHALGYSSKSSKGTGSKQLGACKTKSQTKEMPTSQRCLNGEPQLKPIKRKSKRNLENTRKEIVDNDSSDMEVDTKSRVSIAVNTEIKERNGDEEHVTSAQINSCGSAQEGPDPSTNSLPLVLEDSDLPSQHSAAKSETSSIPNSGQRARFPDFSKIQLSNGESLDGNEGNENEDEKGLKLDSGVDSQHIFEKQASEEAENTCESAENDDKENDLAVDRNREFTTSSNQNGRKVLGMQAKHENSKKALNKKMKDTFMSTTIAAPGLKLKKTKPTNPKPFRLRTDERGILREAKLEKKVDLEAPSRENATVSKFLGGRMQETPGNEKLHEHKQQRNCSDEQLLDREKQDAIKADGVIGVRDLKERARIKQAKATPRRSHASRNHGQKSLISPVERDANKNKITSPRLQHLDQPRGFASSNKTMVSCITSGKKLSVIKENSTEISRFQRAGNLVGDRAVATILATATGTSASSRSSSRGRMRVTIPKEPNFHSTHVPKSCTKQITA